MRLLSYHVLTLRVRVAAPDRQQEYRRPAQPVRPPRRSLPGDKNFFQGVYRQVPIDGWVGCGGRGSPSVASERDGPGAASVRVVCALVVSYVRVCGVKVSLRATALQNGFYLFYLFCLNVNIEVEIFPLRK